MFSGVSLLSYFWDGRWQGLLYFPMFSLASQTFPASDLLAVHSLGCLLDADLRVVLQVDEEGEKNSDGLCFCSWLLPHHTVL